MKARWQEGQSGGGEGSGVRHLAISIGVCGQRSNLSNKAGKNKSSPTYRGRSRDCPQHSTLPLTLRQEEQYLTIGVRSRSPVRPPPCLLPEPAVAPPLAFAEAAASAGESLMPTGAWQKLHLAGVINRGQS